MEELYKRAKALQEKNKSVDSSCPELARLNLALNAAEADNIILDFIAFYEKYYLNIY